MKFGQRPSPKKWAAQPYVSDISYIYDKTVLLMLFMSASYINTVNSLVRRRRFFLLYKGHFYVVSAKAARPR